MFTPGSYARTRHGWPVQILVVLSAPDNMGQSIVGLLQDGEGDELTMWQADGRFLNSNTPSGLDLVTAEALQ